MSGRNGFKGRNHQKWPRNITIRPQSECNKNATWFKTRTGRNSVFIPRSLGNTVRVATVWKHNSASEVATVWRYSNSIIITIIIIIIVVVVVIAWMCFSSVVLRALELLMTPSCRAARHRPGTSRSHKCPAPVKSRLYMAIQKFN